MDLNKVTILVFLVVISLPASSAQTPPAPSPIGSPSPAPAPSPTIHHVNLTELLTVAGPFHTFLSYLLQTGVMEIFQSQANETNSNGGLTLFVPADSAYASLKNSNSTFSNLTNDELKSLLLYHAIPHYYTLSDFKYLSMQNPITTLAGGSYTLNATYDMGLIHVVSSWFDATIISSVYSTQPVAVYVLDKVLLPKEIFSVEPALAPVSAPPPETKPADVAPNSTTTQLGPSSKESDHSTPSSSNDFRVGFLGYLAIIFAGFWIVFVKI